MKISQAIALLLISACGSKAAPPPDTKAQPVRRAPTWDAGGELEQIRRDGRSTVPLFDGY